MAKKSTNSRSTLGEWNDNIHDLTSMKLTKEEKAKKTAMRQSHNTVLAKAELMEQNRQRGMPQTFSPGLSNRLRATGNKTIEEALADSSAALALAHKIKNEELSHSLAYSSTSKSYPSSPRDRLIGSTDPTHRSEMSSSKFLSSGEGSLDSGSDLLDMEKRVSDMSLIQKPMSSDSSGNLYPLSPQGWENLNNTIQLVVKTCEALWQQLEEERMTRERLHLQLQEQRSIITTLTAELLQIQEHQELIMRELHTPRTGGLSSFPRGSSTLGDFRGSQSGLPSDFLRDRPIPPNLLDRFPGGIGLMGGLGGSRGSSSGPYSTAFSDSSIDSRRKKHSSGETGGGDLLGEDFDMDPSPRMLMRLSAQNKSKSVSQLNREQENLLSYIPDSSLLELYQSYR